MKVMTIVGTRPEIIRLCNIIKLLDKVSEHTLVHTGQNYDKNLSDVFFQDLGIRQPDHFLEARGSFCEQMAIMFPKLEALLKEIKPDRFLILGDTNSSLCSIVAKRMGIPVYHMEAGNRCFSKVVPEEVNRKIVDHTSDILLPYTERSRQHLLDEGFLARKVYVTGNPIGEILHTFKTQIDSAKILTTLGLESKKYILATMHRTENVDPKDRLLALVDSCTQLSNRYNVPIIVSTHPRTEMRLKEYGVTYDEKKIRFLKPFGFFDFVKLQKEALCVISDSGTAQEECAILGVPSITLRDVTERPETLECGSNILSGVQPDAILRAMTIVLNQKPSWNPPPEYTVMNVSETVVRILGSVNFLD